MAGEGKDVTLPTLNVDAFVGKSFTTGPGRHALATSPGCATIGSNDPSSRGKFKDRYG
jgi:glycerol transport system substrate-binding protein